MPIVPYDPSNSLSRFRHNKNWSKILFRPDRKLQTTEAIEIQDLIYNQVSRVYASLYDFYTVVKGCQIIVTRIVATGYECILTEGQVYVELFNDSGFFVDTPPLTFTVDRDNITQVGLVFTSEIAQDLPDYRNPHSGGAAFGSEGADRMLTKAEVVISTPANPYTDGFYPLAIIKPKTSTFVSGVNDLGDGRPDIVYYRNEELTEVFNERSLSTYIKKLIELRLYELAGDFVAEGLQLTLNYIDSGKVYVHINPGVAYVKGIRIQINYTQTFQIDPASIETGVQVLFYLTPKGSIEVIKGQVTDTLLLDVPAGTLALGYLYPLGQIYGSFTYIIIPAQTRMPEVSEIRNLQQANDKNTKELADLVLRANLLGLTSDSINENLNGIFVDGFSDLSNTDVFFPEFNASILPAIQAISLPFTSSVKDNRTYTVDVDNSNIIFETITNENNELVPYWGTINGTDEKFYSTDRNITGSYPIPIYNSPTFNVTCSPCIIYKSDENTFINYTHPTIRDRIGTEDAVIIDTPFNDDTYNRTVTLYGSGFSANQDNIQVQINNTPVSTLGALVGSLGSSISSVRADQAGNVAFTFLVPALENAETYTVSLTVGTQEASTTITIIDPEVERTQRELTKSFVNTTVETYESPNSGLSQSFNLNSSVMIKAVEVTLMDYPSLIEGNILNVYITGADSNNRPTLDTYAQGYLTLAQAGTLTTTSPVPPVSTITLNKPVSLPRGSYCLVFETAIDGIELGVNSLTERRLLDGVSYMSIPSLPRVYENNAGTWNRIPKGNNSGFDFIDFNLVLHKPIGLLSTTVIDIVNPTGQEFDIIDVNLSIQNDTKSTVNVYVQDDNDQYQPLETGAFFYQNPRLSTKVRIDMTGTENTHPLINLDNISFNLLQTGTSAVWVSRNQQYESPYDNLSFSVDVYQPDSATFRFYFSSDEGLTWEELTDPTIEVVNASLPVNKYTFFKEDLGFVVLNNESRQRYNLRYKIEIDMDNLEGIYPFFKNVVSITNPK